MLVVPYDGEGLAGVSCFPFELDCGCPVLDVTEDVIGVGCFVVVFCDEGVEAFL